MAKYLSQRIEGPIWLEKAEISFLRAKISEAEPEMKNLDADKFDLTLHSRTDELKKLKNILSPIRRVPLDILSEIFVFACCDDSFGGGPDINAVIWYTPLILASVCVAWKTATHDTPKIWSVLYLRLHNARSNDESWVQRWLSRSRGIPLELYLEHRSGGQAHLHLDGARAIVDTILRFCHQIRILDLWGRLEAFVALFCLPSSSFPLLEKLLLCLWGSLDTDPAECKIPHSLPSDKMEFLLGSSALRDLTSLQAGCHQLKKPDLIVDILQRCNNVVVLELHVPLGLQFNPASPILLPSLRSLVISSGGDNMGPLCHISAPFLENLSLSWPSSSDGNLRICVKRWLIFNNTALLQLCSH
ncbi:hypothetical protein BDP27DRAFT_1364751 [Rhodocollybia butyracea]|uniref:F-box domain-containing protein n=1 Tax=Rhodocollybia butyracea TaxID=206335 RepID=A0A9P5PL79_9AGAR|nr:hypothetical protein BDP27DRAFT_1364751 [Rhodocollybia butyracea]